MMKLLLAAFALVAILSAPALIRSTPAASPNEAIVGGKRIGQHQEANVRFELRRDASNEHY